jgi:putative FmdB family regulatory protein
MMPAYDFKCATCGLVNEVQRVIARRDDPHYCVCGNDTHRVYGMPVVKYYGGQEDFHNTTVTAENRKLLESEDYTSGKIDFKDKVRHV